MTFKKGYTPWMKGRKMSEKHKQKISKANKGRKRPDMIGNEYGIKVGFKKGYTPWNKGKKGVYEHSEEIKLRIGEALKGKYMGSDASNWQGGVSVDPYNRQEWTPTLRRSIHERDGRCMFPECGVVTHLAIHHIDYNKANCDPSNLIALCGAHNTKVNFNREHWEEYFQGLIHNA